MREDMLGTENVLLDQAGLASRVAQLKRERDAVVLAHYYVPEQTQALADYVGDSFYLARRACTLTQSTIVMAGVRFMAESVKMLNPTRTVLNPEPRADCPMAHMVRKEDIDAARQQYADLAVVCYINSTAQVKSWSDVCVTSSNALTVIRALPEKNILFIPDRNLGSYVRQQLPEKHVMLNQGYCPIHQDISQEALHALTAAHPLAKVCAHPECQKELLDEAHYVGSTKQIIDYIVSSEAQEFIVLTVVGVRAEIERLTHGQGKRLLFPTPSPICSDMALVGPEKILHALETNETQVELPDCFEAARRPLERMLELAAR